MASTEVQRQESPSGPESTPLAASPLPGIYRARYSELVVLRSLVTGEDEPPSTGTKHGCRSGPRAEKGHQLPWTLPADHDLSQNESTVPWVPNFADPVLATEVPARWTDQAARGNCLVLLGLLDQMHNRRGGGTRAPERPNNSNPVIQSSIVGLQYGVRSSMLVKARAGPDVTGTGTVISISATQVAGESEGPSTEPRSETST